MRFRTNNKGCLNLFISSLMTAIFINYLVVGFIDYWHNINDLMQWVKQSGIGEYIYRLFGGR
jgi:type III secretory pathway component EscU